MQLAIDFDTPALPVAQAMGEIGMKRALDHAEADEPGFSERAQAFVLEYLRVHGVSSGELVTDCARSAVADGFSEVGISHVLTGRQKTHGGCVWRLAATKTTPEA